MTMKIDLVVTRHPGLVQYLLEQGLIDSYTRVVSHATSEDVAGRHVCGVLPHSLSCLTLSFSEVPLKLPPDLRGKELALDQVREFAEPMVTYLCRQWDGSIHKIAEKLI